MRFLLPHFRFPVFLLFLAATLSCSVYRYSAVRIVREIPLPYHHEKKNISLKRDPGTGNKKNTLKVNKRRYFARILSFSPAAKINNRGVEFAVSGRFREAEVLFNEVLREGENTASLNNLGIIYEIFQNRKKAFSMYSKACIMEPDNENFRANLFSFLESNGRGLKGENNGDEKAKSGYIKDNAAVKKEKN